MSYFALEDFDYSEPKEMNAALSLVSKYGQNSKILAGGTDLLVLMMRRKVSPSVVINISKVKELNFIDDNKITGLRIGALSTLASVERSPAVRENYPVLQQAISLIGSVQIRNMATIGGNLCNASPAADTVPPLLAMNAKLRLISLTGQRQISIGSFFLAPGKSALRPNELLSEIDIEPLPPSTQVAFSKIGRTPTDISKVSAAVLLQTKEGFCQEARIGLGSVAPTPIRAIEAENFLRGKKITNEIISDASKKAESEAKPITDVRSTESWRKIAVRNLVKSLLRKTSGVDR